MIRLARIEDLDAICRFDHVMPLEPHRKPLIEDAIKEQRAWVIIKDAEVVGYGVMTHHFFGRSFLELLYIREAERHQGLGTQLLRHIKTQSRTAKLFTSTNESNTRMQHVLEREGYRRAGIIHEIDENDPELVYVKDVDLAPSPDLVPRNLLAS